MSDMDPEDSPRITDLSFLNPEDLKYRNTQFLLNGGHPYRTGRNESRTDLRRDIWRVRNGDIQRIIDRFPTREPLRQQCAHWMHAVVGKHFFPDANHRTAMAILRKLLAENDVAYGEWSLNRLEQARKASHDIRRQIEPVELDSLYRRDELYEVWLDFFRDELRIQPDDPD